MTFSRQTIPLKPLGSADVMTGFRAPRRGKAHAGLEPLGHVPSAQEQHHQQLRSAAEKLVAQTFFGTLLKQMHESPFRSKLLDGGRGGQAFSSLYNQVLSERMSHSGTARALVDSIVRRNERTAAYEKQSNSLNTARTRKADRQDTDRQDADRQDADRHGAARRDAGKSPGGKPNPYQNVKIHVAPELRA